MNSNLLSSLAVVLSCLALAQGGDPKNPTFETVTVKHLVVDGGMFSILDSRGDVQTMFTPDGGILKLTRLEILDLPTSETVATWSSSEMWVDLGGGNRFQLIHSKNHLDPETAGGWFGIYRKDAGSVGFGVYESGGGIAVYNKTGERVIDLIVDEYGNGQVSAWNRKGKGRTLKPGP